MLSAGDVKQRGRELFTIEASAVRTAAAVVGPLVAGQLAGHEGVGLLVALGALYICVADKFEVSPLRLLLTTLGAMGAVLAGSAVAASTALSISVMAVWALAFGLLALRGQLAAHLGFVLTIVFAVAQGMPLATLAEQEQRALLFGCGGLLSILATLVLRRLTPSPPSPLPPLSLSLKPTPLSLEPTPASLKPTPASLEPTPASLEPTPASLEPTPASLEAISPLSAATEAPSMVWHAVRLTLAATVAVAIEKITKADHGHWIVLSALVIVKPDYAETSRRARERIAGTLVGGIVAVPLAVFLRNTIGLDIVLAGLCLLAYSNLKRSYGMYSALLTPFVVLLVNASHPGDWRLALTRVGDSMAGGALALAVAFLLRPRQKAPAGVPDTEV
jgi:hypothetical protein